MRKMRDLTSKETEYVDELLIERRRANEGMGYDVSAVSAARISGYQDGISYALKTFFDIYLGGKK